MTTAAVLVAATTVVGQATLGSAPPAAAVSLSPSMRYVPLAAPCRAANTVAGSGAVAAGTTRLFRVAGTSPLPGQGGPATGCGVPSGAGAVEVSITAVAPRGNGFVQVLLSDGAERATLLNFTTGTSITNAGTVRVDPFFPTPSDGPADLALKVSGAATDLVVDVQGFFISVDIPTPNTSGYQPLAVPCRVVNTIGTAAGGLGNGAAGVRNVQIAGSGTNLPLQGGPAGGCGVPAEAVAAELVLTVVDPSGNGFLRAGPNTGAAPQSTLVNYTGGTTITNAGVVGLNPSVPLGLTLANFGPSTDVLVDVLGYFVPGGGTTYQNRGPCRIANTNAAGTKIGPGGGRAWQVDGRDDGAFGAQGAQLGRGCGVPARAAAVEIAISAVAPEGTGQLRVSPLGENQATTFVTYTAGRSVTNSGKLTLPVTGKGRISVRNNASTAAFVADVLGFFDPLPTLPLAPQVLDSGVATTCAATVIDVRCWGAGSRGELGDGTLRGRRAPATVLRVGKTDVITVGDHHACASNALQRELRCWGDNSSGQIGTGSVGGTSTPVLVRQPDTQTVIDVSAGANHTCAARANGTVTCWGKNTDGQLGDGTSLDRLTPHLVLGISNAVQVRAGGRHTCALRSDGRVMCWGFNQLGRLGDGTITTRRTPVEVTGITDAVALSVGDAHACAVLNDGGIRCWGSNVSGQIGIGVAGGFAPEPRQPTGLTGVATVAAGGAHTCALLLDGTSQCWGADGNSQLGDGGVATQTTPKPVATLRRATLIDAGATHTCAVRADAVQTKCWGANRDGQAGGFTTPSVRFPDNVPLMSDLVAVTAGGSHTCELRLAGTARCTGLNTSGQLGDGTQNSHDSLVEVVGLRGAVALAAGGNHTCALLLDTTVACWGDNSQGQLGDGTRTNRSSPVPVANLGGISAIAAGASHTCALATIGIVPTVVCWGQNANGQVGNGTTTDSLTPAVVTNLRGAVAITAGNTHTCAALGESGAACWGANGTGQLGNSTNVQSTSPVLVTGLNPAVPSAPAVLGIAAGGSHTCATLADASVRCWGANSLGQLNDGTTSLRTAPVTPGGTAGTVAVGTGAGHTCAVRSTGTVTCFGANSAGQSAAPVITATGVVVDPVGGSATALQNVVAIATGANHNCAVRANGGVRCWGDSMLGQAGTGVREILTLPGTGLGRP